MGRPCSTLWLQHFRSGTSESTMISGVWPVLEAWRLRARLDILPGSPGRIRWLYRHRRAATRGLLRAERAQASLLGAGGGSTRTHGGRVFGAIRPETTHPPG